MKPPILITGCARSGTSLVAGIISICGAFMGDVTGPTPHNRRGQFENTFVREHIVKPYLRSINVDPMGQFPLPDVDDLPIPRDWRDKVEKVFKTQGCKEDQQWAYKGAKMCLFWPVWEYAFPNAKWVIVRRRTGDIATSCCKTGFMRAFRRPDIRAKVGVKSERDGWIWWVNWHLDRFREMIDAGLNVKIVWPERMVDGDYVQIRETIEWLGLEWKPLEVMNFIEPKLWKARRK